MTNLPSDRECRTEAQSLKWDTENNRTASGILRKNGSMKIENDLFVAKLSNGSNDGCYDDDILAFVRDRLASRPKKDEFIEMALGYVQKAIVYMDKRAEKLHGFSGDELESNFVPSYKKQ